MKRYTAYLVALLGAGFSAACNNANCGTFSADPGIIVTVIDSITSQNITPGASAVARQGFFADSVMGGASATSISLAFNRRGIYNVTVHKATYRDWQRNNVSVFGAGCGIRESVEITAKMQK
jgi:hypothetical protein